MDMVNLMLGVEAEFDFTIPQSEITPENFQSVEALEADDRRSVAAGGLIRRAPARAAAALALPDAYGDAFNIALSS